MNTVDSRDLQEKDVVCRHCGARSRAGYRVGSSECPEHPAAGKTTIRSIHEWVEEGST